MALQRPKSHMAFHLLRHLSPALDYLLVGSEKLNYNIKLLSERFPQMLGLHGFRGTPQQNERKQKKSKETIWKIVAVGQFVANRCLYSLRSFELGKQENSDSGGFALCCMISNQRGAAMSSAIPCFCCCCCCCCCLFHRVVYRCLQWAFDQFLQVRFDACGMNT